VKNKNGSWILVHPFLLAIYPVLFLYTENLGQIDFSQILFPAGLLLVLTFLLLMIGRLFLRDFSKIAVFISSFWIFFFTYGRLYRPYKIVLAIAFLISIVWIFKSKIKPKGASVFLTLFSGILILFAVIKIGWYQLNRQESAVYFEIPNSSLESLSSDPGTKQLPDIYYIILDGYGREDILRDIYEFDNSDFIEFLEARGFYLADSSRANYCQTLLSLGSTLNMNYLDNLSAEIESGSNDRQPLRGLVKNNVSAKALKKLGYRTVTFPTGYSGLEIPDADSYITPLVYMNEFENLLIETTPIISLVKRLNLDFLHDIHREIILNAFKRMHRISKSENPYFVIAHVLAPHPPFAFDENGVKQPQGGIIDMDDGSHYMAMADDTPAGYREKYISQLKYINKLAMAAIDSILADSARQSIIILQSDHGPGSMLDWDDAGNSNLDERLSILNALYFPDRNYSRLYKSISPVNTFRVILDQFCGFDMNLLDDKSYFSVWNHPYDFIDIDSSAAR